MCNLSNFSRWPLLLSSLVPGILTEVENFYGNPYASHAPKPNPDASVPKTPLTRLFTKDLSDIDVDEIGSALRQLSNVKATEEDVVNSEVLKATYFKDLRIHSVLSNLTYPSGAGKVVLRRDNQ